MSDEYKGKSANIYELTDRKKYTLVPAIESILKSASKNQKLLDLGCGNGEFYSMITKKGYEYYGLDSSSDMIDIIKSNYPKGNYLIADATRFSDQYSEKFDVILSILLLPALENYQKIINSLKECKDALKKDGELIIGTVNPNYDKYMLEGLLKEKGVKSKFKGYFNSGAKFSFDKFFSKGKFIFTDYHYTWADYFNAFKQVGLELVELIECKPIDSLKTKNPLLFEKYSKYPGYIIFVCKN